MSSILRALKKLESAPAQEDMLKSWRGELDVKKVVGRKSRSLRLGRRSVWLLTAACFLSICTWLFLNWGKLPVREFSQKPPVEPVVAKPKAPPAAVRSVPPKSGSQIPPNRIRPQAVRNRSRSQAVPPKAAATHKVEKPEAEPPSPSETARLSPQPALKTTPSDSPRPESSPAVPTGDAVPIIEPGDGGFVVQAIAWSETPERRIAVINGQVVHEKDSIEGAMVSEIDLDDVYLKKGGKLWRLRFRR